MTTAKVTYVLPVPSAKQAPLASVIASLAVKPSDPAVAPVFSQIGETPVPGAEFDQTSIDPGDYIVRLVVKDTLGQRGGNVDTPFSVPLAAPGTVTNVQVTIT